MKDNIFVIVHGFAGQPLEIQYLADYLKDRGLKVYTFLIAGHGGTKKQLKSSCPEDWVDSVGHVIEELSKYSDITLLGFSMGGLISARFARLPEIKRIVFINTPIIFWNMNIIIKDIINGIRRHDSEKIEYYKSSVSKVSPKSGLDFLRLLHSSKKYFKFIKKPALIVQCKNDESVYYKSAGYIKNKIGESAVLRYYKGGCHQVFSNVCQVRDLICNDIYQWLCSQNRT